MKILTDPRLPLDHQQLVLKLTNILRDVSQQLNTLTEGRVSAVYNAQPAASFAPSGQNAQGDFILNATPAELGTAGGKYILHGWRCTAAGTPGTWVQVRTLTGN